MTEYRSIIKHSCLHVYIIDSKKMEILVMQICKKTVDIVDC